MRLSCSRGERLKKKEVSIIDLQRKNGGKEKLNFRKEERKN